MQHLLCAYQMATCTRGRMEGEGRLASHAIFRPCCSWHIPCYYCLWQPLNVYLRLL